MLIAAMLDAGLDAGFLKSQLATLGIKNLDIKLTEAQMKTQPMPILSACWRLISMI